MNDLNTDVISNNIEQILEYSWLDPDPKRVLKLIKEFEKHNPLNFKIEDFGLELLRLMINPDYFFFTCKHLFNIDLPPIQNVILKELWVRPFPLLVANRGFGKSFLLGLYVMMLLLLRPKTKVVIAGSGFRQSKIIFEYMETIWYNSPILRDICGTSGEQGPHHDTDRYTMKIGNSVAIAIPLGSGDKIRGLRATCIIADEFGVIPEALFETVISGFGSVMRSPIEGIKLEARRKMLINMGFKDYKVDAIKANQTILSGTAYYEFNHFAKYWKKYKNIVESKGDPTKLRNILGADPEAGFDWKDYSVIRIPYEVVPEGFLDIKNIARSKSTVHSGIFLMEYGACFSKDSLGFFPRSLIESCVTNEPIKSPSGGEEIQFVAQLVGSSSSSYVIGVDPAAARDNFSIVVIELKGDHRRVVYAWSTNVTRHKERVAKAQTDEQDYFCYCARKIRNLMKIFPTVAIAMDSQGGGKTIYEAFHNPKNLEPGELYIWPVENPDKEQDTDAYAGLHILHLINFADAKWVSDANNGMKMDFESKLLLFPYFDAISLGMAADADSNTYEGLEECLFEIEELKDELSTIIMTETPVSGRDRWDTPEIKEPNGKKGRLRKDRYSALLMANMVGRSLQAFSHEIRYEGTGGFVRDYTNNFDVDTSGELFDAPDWFKAGSNDLYR